MWMFASLNPHGTIVSGIAGSYAQNNEGIAGVCWDCSLLVLRVSVLISGQEGCDTILDIEGCSYSSQTVSDAIRYAAGWDPGEDVNDPTTWGAIRARVICTAIEGDTFYGDVCDDMELVGLAIDQAYNRGCVIVAISGNASDALQDPPCWANPDPAPGAPNCAPRSNWVPGEIDSALALNPKTITVGGTCRDGSAWHCQSKINPPIEALGSCGTSLYPLRPIDDTAPVISVTAPLEDIISTHPDNTYEFLGEYNIGTSWAAPQVAGVVALMLGESPSLTPAQVKYVLEVTATDIDDPGYDRRTGHGLLNARAALEYVQKQAFPGDWDGDGLVAPIDAVLYAVDLASGNVMTDLNLDANQTADDMTIFLNSYAGN